MQLSALDLISRPKAKSLGQAYQDSVQLAQALDQMGYQRIWYAEHHGSNTHGSSAPEILAAYIAAATQKIRVGTGGTMIMHYSPLKVAEVFKSIATLAPDRVDLGIGRAPGGGPEAIYALGQGDPHWPDDLYQKTATILQLISEEERTDPLYQRIEASPRGLDYLPQAWMLGSSGNSAAYTGRLGMGYSFAKFFGVKAPDDIFTHYRQNFRPSAFHQEAQTMSTYMVIAADSKEEADYQAKALEIARFEQAQNRFNPILSAEEAADIKLSAQAQQFIQEQSKRRILVKGSAEEVRDILLEEKERYQFDEIMVYTPLADQAARRRSYQLIYDHLAQA
ncbi:MULTISPECIES: MsnO8 family LLM class oxidoreductase [Aerococcus]|uniref:MsnO8 family LLM class oxidoreductase n=1 Tax=Aerococcus sanguinicola TaxID=119206 RepID=A0A5N1GLX3_9LACT|nr:MULTISPECIES: MsnO8 family LLM class oxidoreductase [Aerococcus]KAA9301973.1 MsnO8 family LLM class oxidoreductase [Aerococcus sanguinicola]MDK6679685.1 MsnO8 family LLM class oxidoreductase [Aerococcus sp. UMB8608]MDK6686043.1 MsnO8 family LLM class oxidoreductase [Aerococcus sp. UMB8623]MDK6940849.1 MsnO8 family LLM class oxidoreductase [Aerococcus sp. UMB8487]OFK21308.1 hypothetical protein HMPREF2829_03300 [Aerococcus sp. HMSC072A12]